MYGVLRLLNHHHHVLHISRQTLEYEYLGPVVLNVWDMPLDPLACAKCVTGYWYVVAADQLG